MIHDAPPDNVAVQQKGATQVSQVKLRDLTPDTKNANKGTERGSQAIENSLRSYGAGRSILIDKHGRILAGNKTAENAGAIGLDDVIIVQTDGTKLVAVQRMDLDLETDKAAKELAIADNRAGQVSLQWDVEVLSELAAEDVDLEKFWTKIELDCLFETAAGGDDKPNSKGFDPDIKYQVVIDCKDEMQQTSLIARLTDEGLKARAELA